MTAYSDPIFPAIFTDNDPEIRVFDRDLLTALGNLNSNLQAILDRGISFDDNVDVTRVHFTTHATPGMEFSVLHGLGKLATGYIVCGQSAAGSIYDGPTDNTTTVIYLRSDVSAADFHIMVF